MNSNDISKSARPVRLAVATALAVSLSAPVLAFGASQYDATEASKVTDTQSTTEAPSTGRMAAKNKVAERDFLDTAISGSQKEVAAAQLAKEHAVDARVREVANRLERDHQDLINRLVNAADAVGVRLSRSYHTGTALKTDSRGLRDVAGGPTVTGMPPLASGGTRTGTAATASGTAGAVAWGMGNDPDIKALSANTGAGFDRAFLDRIVADHERDIAEFSRASTDTKLSARVRGVASDSLPTLRENLEAARSLKSSLENNAMQ